MTIKESSKMLKAIANSKRLEILYLLSHQEMNVGNLQKKVNLSQSALSQHLAVLRKAGLLTSRRQAQSVYYKTNNTTIKKILQLLKEN